jgi:microcystin-dependent protein
MDPYLGEIQLSAFYYPPKDWMFCEGQLLPVHPYADLFGLLGTTYGGDGQNTFALPDLRGRTPVGVDGTHARGAAGGKDLVLLSEDQLPAHTHPPFASASDGSAKNVANNVLGSGQTIYAADPGAGKLIAMSPEACEPAGGGKAHNNMQPYLPLRWIICVKGAWPA